MVASSYLAYGGTMRIARANDSQLTNAFVGAATSVKIKSNEHYVQLGYDENTAYSKSDTYEVIRELDVL
jgi:hypothetical protein